MGAKISGFSHFAKKQETSNPMMRGLAPLQRDQPR